MKVATRLGKAELLKSVIMFPEHLPDAMRCFNPNDFLFACKLYCPTKEFEGNVIVFIVFGINSWQIDDAVTLTENIPYREHKCTNNQSLFMLVVPDNKDIVKIARVNQARRSNFDFLSVWREGYRPQQASETLNLVRTAVGAI